MADPIFKPAYDLHVTVDSVVRPCTSSEFSETHATFEATTDQDGGAYNFGVAETTYTLRFDMVRDTAADRIPNARDLVAMAWTDGVENYSGKGRILTKNRKGGGRGGAAYSFTATLAGTVTKS